MAIERAFRLLFAAGLTLGGCDEHRLQAVSGSSCREAPEQAACAQDSWPNAYSSTNSDRWLETHADGLRVMRPRVLVLDFHNPLSLEDMQKVVDTQLSALAEGSRYHGYKDPLAPAFLQYEMSALIDLRDPSPPAGWLHTSSTRAPLDANGSFDVAALFKEPYTELIGQEDPEQPGRLLGLCEQFKRGLIHEVWLAVGDEEPGREPYPMIECKVPRDGDGHRASGPWVSTGGKSECAKLPSCDVTVRIAHLSPLRGVGCDLFVRNWAITGSLDVIPYLRRNASRFFYADLDTRYGAPASNLLELCAPGPAPCFQYPTATTLEYVGTRFKPFRLEGYGMGCGTTEFPPNAATIWDWQNKTKVQTRCEHYGLRDGVNGSDLPSTYSHETISAWADRYPDCGGAWQIYLRQNMPGLDNLARDEDGKPMKNWWPFLFF